MFHPFIAPMISLSIGQIGQLLNDAFGSLGGQVNMWLIGLVLAPLAWVLGWEAGIAPLLGKASWYAATPVFPWQIPSGSPYPDWISFGIGMLAFAFIAMKLLADIIDGRKSVQQSGPALAFNAVLMLFAPLIVWVMINLGFNHFTPYLLAAVPGQSHRIGTLNLVMSLLGYSGNNWTSAAWPVLLISLSAAGSLGALGSLSGVIGQLTSIAIKAPVLILLGWAIALDVIIVEITAAFLFLALTPYTPVLFGVFASSMNTARTWLRLFIRATAAIVMTFLTGLAWYMWFAPTAKAHPASDFAAKSILLGSGTAVLGVTLYLALAFLLWVIWLRPLLLVGYAVVVPLATGVLHGAASASAVGAHLAHGDNESPGATPLGRVATALAGAGEALQGPAVQRVLTFGEGHLGGIAGFQDPAAGKHLDAKPYDLQKALMSSLKGPGFGETSTSDTPKWASASVGSGRDVLRSMPHGYSEVPPDPKDANTAQKTVGRFDLPSTGLADLFENQFSGTAMTTTRLSETSVQVAAPDADSIEAVVTQFGGVISSKLQSQSVIPVWKMGGKYVIDSNGIAAEVPASVLRDPKYMYFGEVRG